LIDKDKLEIALIVLALSHPKIDCGVKCGGKKDSRECCFLCGDDKCGGEAKFCLWNAVDSRIMGSAG